MEFEWDEEKNRQNLRKHGLDLGDAKLAFDGPLLVKLDTREDYGEDRWTGVGMIKGRVLVLVFT